MGHAGTTNACASMLAPALAGAPMSDREPESLLRRAALGLWFCAIAALGLLQFYGRAFQDGAFSPGTTAWLWLAGSLVLVVVGIALIVRAARR